jgi:hypothetical protein
MNMKSMIFIIAQSKPFFQAEVFYLSCPKSVVGHPLWLKMDSFRLRRMRTAGMIT